MVVRFAANEGVCAASVLSIGCTKMTAQSNPNNAREIDELSHARNSYNILLKF